MWATRWLLLAALSGATGVVAAASNSELEARIQKLERMMDSRGLLGLLDQVETLQREVQELRGELEVQSHELERAASRQRELYLDIDRRLHRLESGGKPGEAPGPAVAPPPAAGARPPAAPAGKPPLPAAPASAEERADYDRALALLREGRYTDSAAAFEAFLQKYPQSAYTDNAWYWLGEVHYVARRFPQALEAFGTILNDYPKSSKASDALLKTGYIQYELRQWKQARATLGQVVREFPGSTAARLATERLERMKREGH